MDARGRESCPECGSLRGMVRAEVGRDAGGTEGFFDGTCSYWFVTWALKRRLGAEYDSVIRSVIGPADRRAILDQLSYDDPM